MKITYGQLVSLLFRELSKLNLDDNPTFEELKDFIQVDFENKQAIILPPFSEYKDKPIVIQLDKSNEEIK